MSRIDWQALYAANRAAIARATAPRGLVGLPSLEPAGPPRRSRPAATRGAQARAQSDGGLSYVVHRPSDLSPDAPVALVMMLHGCTQDAASIAAGTRMNRLADRAGFVVVYPQQDRRANPQGCWNWFAADNQRRGTGEPALLAEVLRSVMAETSEWNIDPARVFVAGMSAGGAMASVMAATYPDLFAAVAVHSGLAYGVARSQATALAAMAGAGPDAARLGELAARTMSSRARPLPVVVIHGGRDRVVTPANGDRVVEQWMVTNRLISPGLYHACFGQPTSVVNGQVPGGHRHRHSRWVDRRGRVLQEYVRVEELGHAWSGGARGGSYTDDRGPDASETIWSFFERAV